jgi:putative SOS response-associated peptidase YedK
VIRPAGNVIELAPMNFSFPPSGPRGGPVFNFRSEGRRFDKSNRCLVPASAFFEFTGKKYPKTKHRFTLRDEPFMAIAGIWQEGQDGKPAFTMLTTEPGRI